MVWQSISGIDQSSTLQQGIYFSRSMARKSLSDRALSTPSAYERTGRWLALGTTAIASTVYLLTLAPGPTFEHYGVDSGDLITAAWTLGVPHPSGYPTYTLLAWLFSHLPVGSIAYRVNLLSAVCAALAAGFLCRTAQLLWPAGKSTLILSVISALMLAFSPLFWSQAVIAEVYALLALLAATILWSLVRWKKGGSDGLLMLAALVLGLGLGNHLTLIFVAPAALVLLWPDRRPDRRPDRGRWLRVQILLPAAGLFLIGLSVYAYLPLAAAHRPPVNWGNPQTWDRFLWVVTAKQYQQFAFGLPLEEIGGRLATWASLLGNQFGWWGLAIALAGAWWWWQRDRRFMLFALSWMAPLATYAFLYNTGDAHVYLLPAIMLLALCWGEGARYLLHLARRLRPTWQQLILVILILLPLASLGLQWQAIDLSDDWFVYAYIYETLAGVDPDGLVIVRGDRATFALWYAVYAEEQRPDVALVSGPMLAFIWYRDHVRHLYPDLTVPEPTASDVTTDDLVRDLIVQNYNRRPIYATDPKETWETWFEFVPVEGAHLDRVRPRTKWERGE